MTDRTPIVALLRSDPRAGRYGGVRLSHDTLRVLSERGHRVGFVAPGDVAGVRPVEVDGVRGHVVPFASGVRRLRPGIPYQVTKRLPIATHRDAVIAALRVEFAGTTPVLLLEQFPMYAWFAALAAAFPRWPRILREHNDEPRYAAMVSVHERRARRAMAVRELKAVTRLYHDSGFLGAFDGVVSISAEDDVARYDFTAPVSVVTAFLSPPGAERHDVADPPFDFGVFGSLDHGPNADAVVAFLTTVWPAVASGQQHRLLVAGRSPTPAVRELAAAATSTELLADPSERAAVYDRCRAMVDPSVDGTGVAVKTLEALTFGRPVIGYAAARRGLPASLRAYVMSASSPPELAELLASPDHLPPPVPAAAVVESVAQSAQALSDVIDGVARGS